MNRLARPNAALGALVALVLLADALVRGGVDERQVPLVVLAALGIAWFVRPGSLRALAVLVPAGVILDMPLLTEGRGIYATEVVLLTAVAGWASRIALGRVEPPVRPPLPSVLIVGYGIAVVVGLVFGHADMLSSYAAVRMIRVALLACVLVVMIQPVATTTSARARFLGLWPAASLVALGLLALFGLAEFARDTGSEPGSFYRGSVGLANHIALVSPLALAWALGGQGRRRMIATGVWVLAMLCLPLTASRGALGSVLITSAATGLLMLRGGRRRGLLLAGGALALVLVVLAVKPDIAGESFAYKYRKTVEGDFFSTRIDAWGEAGSVVAEHPLVGAGPEAWAPSVPLELAARHGLPAAAFALAGLGMAAWAAFRRIGRGLDPTAVGVALGLTGFLLVGLAETGIGARTTPLLVMTVVMSGLLAAQKTEE